MTYIMCITCGASPAVHHLRYITCGPSHAVHHLRSRQYLQCITCGASPMVHHLPYITFGASPFMMHHWFIHHHHIWHPWVISFSKIWHMLGLLVILSLSLSLSLCVSLSLSSRGRQWIVRVMSFRNMYGYVGLWSIGSDFKGSPVEKLEWWRTKSVSQSVSPIPLMDSAHPIPSHPSLQWKIIWLLAKLWKGCNGITINQAKKVLHMLLLSCTYPVCCFLICDLFMSP